MTGDEYQAAAATTAMYREKMARPTLDDMNILYTTLGLAGEAGEVADKVKKALRDGKNACDLRRDPALLKELGDVAWYLSQCANELGFSLDEVFAANVAKLRDRRERDVISGDGDER